MNDDLVTTGTPRRAHGRKQPGGKQLAPGTAPRRQNGERRAGETPELPERKDRWQEEDEKLDQALKGTFPASDPFSI